MKRKVLCAAAIALFCIPALRAENAIDVSMYGFVTNQMYWQDRENYQAVDGLLNFFPKDVALNDIGEDMNSNFNSTMIAINTRLGVVIKGPEMLKARTMAQFEGDFSTSGMVFFLRQGFIRFDWNKDRVLFGQTGHPMCTDLMPGTINIAVGCPFNALNRSPMLRYDHFFGEKNNFSLTAAAIYQYWSGRSTGPEGYSNMYHRHSGIPELWGALSYQAKGFSVEAGIDWLQLRPRTANAEGHKVDETVSGPSAMLQLSYNHRSLSLRAKTLYGYNMSHLNLATGYGVSDINSDGSYEYAPLKATSSWIFASYGRTWRGGFLVGFMKNLGADKDLVNPNELLWVYGGDTRNIDMIYRICPQLEYIVGNFNFGIEYEVTTAAYGHTIESRGTVTDTYNVTNNRIMLTTKYTF